MLDRPLILNVMQSGDALDLLRALPDSAAVLVFFDPQHRDVLDRLAYGHEGQRQRGRCVLPAMSSSFIDAVCYEIARVLKPSATRSVRFRLAPVRRINRSDQGYSRQKNHERCCNDERGLVT
jgi:hypothetical protein